jgi:hypothetical protein
LIEACLPFQAGNAHGLEDAQSAESVGIRSVFRFLERNGNVALGREIVDFVWLHLANNPNQARRIREIAVVKPEGRIGLVRIEIEMINAVRIEEGGSALDAVDLVSLLQKKFGQIGAVLAGDAGNQCSFLCHINPKMEICAYTKLTRLGRVKRSENQA